MNVQLDGFTFVGLFAFLIMLLLFLPASRTGKFGGTILVIQQAMLLMLVLVFLAGSAVFFLSPDLVARTPFVQDLDLAALGFAGESPRLPWLLAGLAVTLVGVPFLRLFDFARKIGHHESLVKQLHVTLAQRGEQIARAIAKRQEHGPKPTAIERQHANDFKADTESLRVGTTSKKTTSIHEQLLERH